MIQALDNDLLRSLAGQQSNPQALQEALRGATTGPSTQQVQPASSGGDSSQVNLSDASRLINALNSQDSGMHPVANALGKLMEQLTGQKVADVSIGSQSLQASSFSYDTVEESLKVGGRSGIDYRYHTLHAEGDQLSYSAQGTLKLQDGTEMSFEFKLDISRITVEETSGSVQVDGADLRKSLGTGQDGVSVRPRQDGFDADLDHRAVRRLLDGVDESSHGRGRHRAHGRHHHSDDAAPTAATPGVQPAAATDPAAADSSVQPADALA